jgi:regulator of RNase E activity RraA
MQFLPRRGTGLKTYNVYSEVIPSAQPGEVLVIAGNGLPGWAAGENQINHSIQYGLVAWVTDMHMRDVAEIRDMGFPVLCTGATPETFSQEIVGLNVPVHVAGAQVRGGDIIVADDDGVVVIPIEAFDRVMANVRDMAEKEAEQERLIKSKAPLDELTAFLATKGRAV